MDGHITLQTRFMRETLAERQSCLQSDSVHGMIKDPQYGADIYVSYTSGYCAALERSIPLVVTILFGCPSTTTSTISLPSFFPCPSATFRFPSSLKSFLA